MTKPFLSSVACILFVFLSLSIVAQKMPIKFGKVGMEDLQMTGYEKDPNASAVILCDFGKTIFQYNDNVGFQLHFTRNVRIKIFNKEAYDWANWKIELWNDDEDDDKEKIIGLKGFTFNLVEGKIEKDKLSNENEFKEKIHDNLSSVNFTMPNVKEGSVIDIEYTIVSPFYYNLQDWYFQYDIPVVWSELHVYIPEYYSYNHLFKGYVALHISENEKGTNSFTYNIKSRTQSGIGQRIKSSMQTEVFQYQESHNRYVAVDVPAFIVEEPLTSKENFISKIEFELSQVELPYATVKTYSESWESINKKLMQNPYFGDELKGGGFLNEIVDTIVVSAETDLDKMLLAYDAIKDRMTWNDFNSLYVSKNLRSAFNEGSGNVADINLMLVVLLRALELKADPVILSTRANGMIHPAHPTMSSFNYVIAQTEIDGEKFLLDATEPRIAAGMLPVRTQNNKGRLISKEGTDWVDLQNSIPFESLYMYNLQLGDNGVMTGSVQSSEKGYAGYTGRNTISTYVDEDRYIEELEKENSGLNIIDYSFQNLDEYRLPVKGSFTVEIANHVEEIGNMIYFKPMFFEAITDNPFKLEERNYPIEYPYQRAITYMLNFTIPDGYVLDDKPEDVAVSLPENAATFIFRTTVVGNMVQVLSKYTISQLTYIPEDYEFLKEFYNMMINKHAEQIVLVKE
jgi:hypothetical protein